MRITRVPTQMAGTSLAYRVGACTVIFSKHAEQRCEERGYDPRAVALRVVLRFPTDALEGADIPIPGIRHKHKRTRRPGTAIAFRVKDAVMIKTVLPYGAQAHTRQGTT